MPNIASALKAEITRIARRELKSEAGALKSASTRYRSDIAALKRDLSALERRLKNVSASSRPASADDEKPPGSRHRFSAKGFASQRKRLGLSAEAMGKLIGVTALSVYNWETGKVRPRENYLPALAALKTLGKKTAAAVLATR